MHPYENNSSIPSAKHPRHQLRIVIRSSSEVPRIPVVVITMIKSHDIKIKNSVATQYRLPILQINHMYAPTAAQTSGACPDDPQQNPNQKLGNTGSD